MSNSELCSSKSNLAQRIEKYLGDHEILPVTSPSHQLLNEALTALRGHETSRDDALRVVARLLPYAQQHEPCDAFDLENQLSLVAEAEKLLVKYSPLEPKAPLPEHVHSWDGDQCHYCHIPRSSVENGSDNETIPNKGDLA